MGVVTDRTVIDAKSQFQGKHFLRADPPALTFSTAASTDDREKYAVRAGHGGNIGRPLSDAAVEFLRQRKTPTE
jgi:hypothetical protein